MHRKFNWHLLRGFGQSVPAAITMATPFIGYMILYHSQIEQYLGGLGGLLEIQSAPDTCKPYLGFASRLNLIYSGSLFLGIGTIFFKIFAPTIIKISRDSSEYVTSALDTVSARSLRSMFATIEEFQPTTAAAFKLRSPWLDSETNLKTASDALKKEDHQISLDVLRCFYEIMNGRTSRGAVYLVTICYGLGFLLIAVPGIAFTLRVMCTMLTASK